MLLAGVGSMHGHRSAVDDDVAINFSEMTGLALSSDRFMFGACCPFVGAQINIICLIICSDVPT